MSRLPPAKFQSAGVRFDPQYFFAIVLAIGLLSHHWYPVAVLPPRLAMPIGIASLVFGLFMILPAAQGFRRARTTLQPWEQTTALVTTGPYRFSRNPIYVGYTGLYMGAAFWVNALWPFVLLPGVLWVIRRAVITREEVYLESLFGDAYRAYRARVRRWL